MVRPGTEDFLKKMSELFEIVIFTAAMQDYADWVLDQLDPDKYITHRCYRQHALPYGAIFVKVYIYIYILGYFKTWERFIKDNYCG